MPKKKEKKKKSKDSVNPVNDLREFFFNLDPKSLDLYPTEDLPRVWGFMMEIYLSQTWVDLICIADGTVSIYTGFGGGLIGAGEHLSVRNAARACLKKAEEVLDHFKNFDPSHIQDEETIKFHILTYNGIRSDEANTDNVINNDHYLSELHNYAQNVITEVRLVETS